MARVGRFEDRREAGQLLAAKLNKYAQTTGLLVLALPRGGVPVAFEVAKALNAPMDIFVVRKLGVPWEEELAMGAIAPGGIRVLNEEIVSSMGIPNEIIEKVAEDEANELKRREIAYRGHTAPPEVAGKTVIVVDDGIATGSTMRSAVAALRRHDPSKLIVAAPTAAASSCEELRDGADEVVAVITPEPFYAVGAWYRAFAQTSDDEVRELYRQHRNERLLSSTSTPEPS
ncbi:MAG: phosphoribosyltransferase [Verrucomicrobia bacterium]|nr:phosphoribosyltransferase [Verrucomicrobiota bacterium]